jgi:hypothetical protein
MGIFSGFPFETNKDRERISREFDNRMFPLGAEKQWEKTLEVLNELIDDKYIKNDMILFAYMSAKDKYTMYKEDGFGTEAARNELDRVIKKNVEAKKLILTLIQLDTEIESLDDYPTPEHVREVAALSD